MQRSTIASAVIATGFALVAAILARQWLQDQRETILAEVKAAGPSQTVVIALHDVEIGTRVAASDFGVANWSAPEVPKGAFTRLEDLITTEGDARFVTATIYSNEPVLEQRLSRPGQQSKLSASIAPGMRAVSIRVNDVQGVAGFVLPGDHVDVYLSHDGGRGAGTAYVDLILQDAKVVAIDQISDLKNEAPSVVRTVTFEVTPEQAQQVTLAGTIGTLSLSLRNQAEQGESTAARLTSTDLGLTEPAPPAEPTPQATPEPEVPAPAAPPTVGVIRNGQRESYPVDMHPKAPQ